MRKLTVLFLTFFSTLAFANPMQVEILGENWLLGYDIGKVAEYNATISDHRFQYMASNYSDDTAPNTILMLDVKNIASQSKEMCFDELWTKNQKEQDGIFPEKQKINHLPFPNYEQVTYLYADGSQNANYYFVKNGKCIDVHISVPKDTPNAEKLMTQYGKSLTW